MRRVAVILMLAAAPLLARAQQLADAGDRILAVSPEKIRLLDRAGNALWSGGGLRTAGSIAVGNDRAAILDPLRNEAVVIALSDGRRKVLLTAETPIAATFFGDDLFILSRDGRVLEKVAGSGARASVVTGVDPAFLRRSGDSLFVYSRVDGLLQVIDPRSLTVRQSLHVAPFASDMEIDATTVYLLFPREAKLRQWDLATLRPSGEMTIGAVPVDAAFTRRGNALSATTIAIADPAARRVWMIEGRQSRAQAFGRGFLRGLLGLGLFRSNGREFPTGVDRITARDGHWIGYDTSTGALYRISRKSVDKLASGIAPGAFTLTRDGVAWLDGERLQSQKW